MRILYIAISVLSLLAGLLLALARNPGEESSSPSSTPARSSPAPTSPTGGVDLSQFK